MFTLNGKPLRSGDLARTLEMAAVDSVKQQLRERIESIRLPETGEFPTVIFDGDTLDSLSARVEGSTLLLELVLSRLSPEEQAGMTFHTKPKVFLSYGGEDRELAEKIARALQASGIETWWAEWELNAGDSLRLKIDEGLGSCTHFIVLLTPTSKNKPWVSQEMDAGLVRKLQQRCQFIRKRPVFPSSFALPA